MTVSLVPAGASATSPRVTVVVPCYRYGRYLPEVVSTTLSQAGVVVDVVIVDDASPDGSGDVAQSLADRFPNVSVIRHQRNQGHIATYNTGLAQASGTYVVLLSADDLLTPGSLARATAMMEAHPEVGLVYGHVETFTDTVPALPRPRVSWSIWSGERWLERIMRRGMNVISSPEVVMRRSLLDELGGYEPTLPHAADLFLWLRAAGRASVGRVNGCVQALYRVHGANMHLTDYSDVLSDITQRFETFELFLSGDYRHHARRTRCLELARQGVALEAVRWGIFAHDHHQTDWPDTMARHGDFARSAWPRITSTSIWRRFRRRQDQEFVSSLDRLMFQGGWDLRHRLRWQRWRHLGT